MLGILKRIFSQQKTNKEKVVLLKKPALLEVDIVETEREVVIIAPLGGVKKESIQVSLTEKGLKIQGERSRVNLEGEPLLQECYFGPFERELIFSPSLLQKLSRDKISWSLSPENVLFLKIPKIIETGEPE